MDLWIRSQDKKRLMKVNNFKVGGTYGTAINAESDVFSINLGEYKTKERALEVLDKIQIFIEKQGTSEATVSKYGIMNGIKVYGNVYEMPKE